MSKEGSIARALARVRQEATIFDGDLYGAYDQGLEQKVYFNDIQHHAVKFAKRHNCPEITGGYVFPKGVSGTDIQVTAMGLKTLFNNDQISEAEYDEFLSSMWTELVELNPNLKRLQAYQDAPMKNGANLKPMKASFHLIMGVGDQFNMNDIEFFLQKCISARAHMFNKLSSPPIDMRKRVEAHFSKIAWAPSLQTLQMLQDIHLKRQSQPSARPSPQQKL